MDVLACLKDYLVSFAAADPEGFDNLYGYSLLVLSRQGKVAHERYTFFSNLMSRINSLRQPYLVVDHGLPENRLLSLDEHISRCPFDNHLLDPDPEIGYIIRQGSLALIELAKCPFCGIYMLQRTHPSVETAFMYDFAYSALPNGDLLMILSRSGNC